MGEDIKNYGIFQGRISHMASFQNSNGSKTFVLTLAKKRGYGNSDESDFVEFHGFVKKDSANDGVYQYLDVGDLISVKYSLRSNRTEKNGTKQYYQTLVIDRITIDETKAVREERRAKKSQRTTQSSQHLAVRA